MLEVVVSPPEQAYALGGSVKLPEFVRCMTERRHPLQNETAKGGPPTSRPASPAFFLIGGSVLLKELLFGGRFGQLNFADSPVGGLIGFQVFL